MRILRIVLGALLAIVVATLVMTWFVERGRRTLVMGEEVSPDEARLTSQIIGSAIDSVNQTANGHPPYRRDVHSKAHGCVAATVEVDPDVPVAYRAGVFRTPGDKYAAWIRFSNGNTVPQADSIGDARGMALKLMGVKGKKLLEPQQEADTQDFIMINSPVFFIRNVPEYAKFTRRLSDGDRYGYFFGGYSWNPLQWHLRDMYLALRTLKKAPPSLLHERYYSLSAYKLGDRNIKFSAMSCTVQAVARVDRKRPDFLRDEMRAELASGDACFKFMVQPQVDGRNMPVEDPTVEWKESDSPFVPVATITIPTQKFDDPPSKNDDCEALSFSPWHALPEHRPLGGLNRIRKAVYLEDARYRRAKTGGVDHTPYVDKAEP